MRTTVSGGATGSASFDQLQLTQIQSSIKSVSNHGNQLGTTDMMLRMLALLAGNPSGSSVHASYGGW